MFNDKTLDRLSRASIGYDPFFSLFERAGIPDSQGYPPYNIEKTGDDTYRITLALAGIRPEELGVEVHRGVLTVEHLAEDRPDQSASTFLHRGIATRPFRRQFRLAENVEVIDARMEHGLLHLSLERQIPEDQRPRRVPVTGAVETHPQVTLEGDPQDPDTGQGDL